VAAFVGFTLLAGVEPGSCAAMLTEDAGEVVAASAGLVPPAGDELGSCVIEVIEDTVEGSTWPTSTEGVACILEDYRATSVR
jgi:hypothetical protein